MVRGLSPTYDSIKRKKPLLDGCGFECLTMTLRLDDMPNLTHSGHPTKRDKWLTQQKRVFASLFRSPKTRLQVSHYEGIPIQNVCRYIASFRKSGTLYVVKVDTDELSGMKAEYLTTNPELIPSRGQLSFFD